MKPRSLFIARLSLPLASALATLFSAQSAQSQTTYYWDNNGITAGFGNAGGTWTAPTVNQWSTDLTGVAATGASVTTTTLDPVIFGTNVANRGLGSGTITVTGTVDAASLTFGSQTTGNVLLSGGTINLAPISTISVGAGSTTVQTISSALTGAGTSLTKSGNTLALSGANNYSGATNVTVGSLVYRNTGAKSASSTHTFSAITTLGLGVGGTGFFSAADVTNAFSGSMTGNLSNVVVAADTNVGIDTTAGNFTYTTPVAGSPTRGLTKFGANTLTLTGANTYTGATNILGGILRLENTSAITNTSRVSVGSGTTLLLAANAPFPGTTPLSMTGGTVSSSVLTPGAGITHAFGNLAVSNSVQTFTKGVDATGATAAIQIASVSNASGANGTATLNPTTANLIVTGGYTSTDNAGTNNLVLSGTGSMNSIDGVISNGTRVTQNLSKIGTSTWTLSGANTHNGATSVTAGTLILANSLALQNSSLDTSVSVLGTATNGFNAIVGALTFGGLTGINDLASRFITGGYSGVTALTLNPGSGVTHTYSGIIADGAGGMTVTKTGAGTQVLSGANAYTGGTTVTAGILQPTLATALAEYTSPGEVLFNGGTISIVLDEAAVAGWSTTQVNSLLTNATKTSGALGIDTTTASVSFAPTSLSGAIGLTKLGINTLTLTGANTHTGNTAISAGTLRLENTGAVQNSAVVSVNTNTLQVASDATFSSSTPLSINGGTIVSDRATSGAGLTHGFGNLAVSHTTQNFTAGANVTTGTAAIQVASMTCGSGSGGSATLNPVGVNLIITGTATGANTGTSNFNLGGTSTGNTIGGIGNGTRTTQNVIKSNTSTWTLNGVNTYTGNTTVSNGTLTMTTAASASNANANNDASTVTISDNGTSFLDLAYTGTDVVTSLVIGTTAQAPGVYGSTTTLIPPVTGIPQITGTGTITVGAGFSSWITNAFTGGATVPSGQQGENDDPDNDGISNLVEFAIAGQDPTVGNTTIGTFDGITLSFDKRQPLASSLTYSIQDSTDLGIADSWASVTGTPPTYVNDDDTISYTLTPGTPVSNFLRLQVVSD